MVPARADEAADRVHDAGAGEVERAVAEAEVGAELREPAAAPDPHAVDRVDERGHEDAVEDERGELPALGHGAGDDGGGGVHEHELEQEERDDADVVRADPPSERSPWCRRCPSPSRPRTAPPRARSTPPSVAERAEAAELKAEADDPVASAPIAKMTKFIIATCAAFFARQKPVSTSMKPACMKKMSATPTMTKNMFVPTFRWPRSCAISATVGLPAVAATTSAADPVLAPVGSPAAYAMPTMSARMITLRMTVLTTAFLRRPGSSGCTFDQSKSDFNAVTSRVRLSRFGTVSDKTRRTSLDGELGSRFSRAGSDRRPVSEG